jgi:hypothetical protein
MDKTPMLIYSLAAFFRGVGQGGKDMVYSWEVESLAADGWKIIPWEPCPILIVGYQLVKLKGRQHDWFMIGNLATPDPVGFLGPKENSLQVWYPDGGGQYFPPKGAEKHIDIHGHGKGFQWLALTIYYGRLNDHDPPR